MAGRHNDWHLGELAAPESGKDIVPDHATETRAAAFPRGGLVDEGRHVGGVEARDIGRDRLVRCATARLGVGLNEAVFIVRFRLEKRCAPDSKHELPICNKETHEEGTLIIHTARNSCSSHSRWCMADSAPALWPTVLLAWNARITAHLPMVTLFGSPPNLWMYRCT